MAFYLLTQTYFNDVNGGRNILLINSQLKRIHFYEQPQEKMKQNWKRQKNLEKENNNDKRDFSEKEIPDLNSLKPFKFEPKTNIGDIISSSSDDEEE